MQQATEDGKTIEAVHSAQYDPNSNSATIIKDQSGNSEGSPEEPNTTSPYYNLNARCAYHSESPGHDTNDC